METGWAITSTMIGGIVALGGLGYLIGKLIGAEQVSTGIGFVLGAGLAVYSIWLRYGKDDGGEA